MLALRKKVFVWLISRASAELTVASAVAQQLQPLALAQSTVALDRSPVGSDNSGRDIQTTRRINHGNAQGKDFCSVAVLLFNGFLSGAR
jgi:hypothetical protein